MIDARTIAEVLKKDRDGSAYEVLEKELEQAEELQRENNNLKELIRDFQGEGVGFSQLIRFANLLHSLNIKKREWRGYISTLDDYIVPWRGLSGDEEEMMAIDILKFAEKISLGSDHWSNEEFVYEIEDIIKHRAEELNDYIQKIERAETRWMKAMKEATLEENNLHRIRNMGFWDRLKWLFKGD